MAGRTLIDGVYKTITGGNMLVDGVSKKIKCGKALIDGVVREIRFDRKITITGTPDSRRAYIITEDGQTVSKTGIINVPSGSYVNVYVAAITSTAYEYATIKHNGKVVASGGIYTGTASYAFPAKQAATIKFYRRRSSSGQDIAYAAEITGG